MRSFAIGIGIAFLSAGAALAQGSQACVQLERQLAALDQNSVSPQEIRRTEESVARQRYELDRTIAYSRNLGCGRTFLFGPAPSPQCRDVEGRIDQQRNNLDRLMVQAQRARAGDPSRDARRNQILGALAQNQCGPQYANAPRQQRPGGIFGLLFGGGGGQEELVEPNIPYEGGGPTAPNNDSFRTVCVRMCDGFFYPVSYSTTPANFSRDAQMCQQTCPGTQVDLYTYPNPGGDLKQAANMSAQSYGELPNAYRFQKEFVKDCSCKPAGQTWAQAMSGAQDPTVRQGDIVIDENRAREMSTPQKPKQ